MDRSGRRTTVVVWAITAGVMFSAVAATAPAAADDSATASDTTADRDHHRTRGRVPTPEPAPHGLPGVRGGGNNAVATDPAPDPCPWPWPAPFSPVLPEGKNYYVRGGIEVESPDPDQVTPVSKLGNGRAPASDDPDAPDLALPPAQQLLNPAGGATDAMPAPAPIARVRVVSSAPAPDASAVNPPGFTPSARPLGPAGLSQPPVRLSRPVAAPPGAALQPPQPPQLGYPPELRPDELGRIAAGALPGLAALVGMTVLGGLIGYRQARAGYVLRAAGAGRFLQ